MENISALGNWSAIEERETELLTPTPDLSFQGGHLWMRIIKSTNDLCDLVAFPTGLVCEVRRSSLLTRLWDYF